MASKKDSICIGRCIQELLNPINIGMEAKQANQTSNSYIHEKGTIILGRSISTSDSHNWERGKLVEICRLTVQICPAQIEFDGIPTALLVFVEQDMGFSG